MNKNQRITGKLVKSLFIAVFVGMSLAACSSTPVPEPTIESQFWLNRTYVDKDAAGLNNGTNWVNAFTSLQDALDCARQAVNPCPGPIWVAGGTYYPDEGLTVTNNDASESFYLVRGINMYGGFDGVGPGGIGGAREQLLTGRNIDVYKTILSGDIRQNDVDSDGDGYIQPDEIVGTNSQHVVYVDTTGGAVTSSTVLDGFRIFQGSNTSSGAGLYCGGSVANACSPALANLVFRGNKSYQGAGVANYYSASSYTHVAFLENEATGGGSECGGGIYNYLSNLTMNDVQFTRNSAYSGGGMCNKSSSPVITEAMFEYNSAEWHGGGIYNEEYEGVQSNTSLTEVTFFDNSAVSGGAIYGENSGPTLLRVGFYGNSAAVGGAMSNTINGGLAAGAVLPLRMTNVVFSGNSATDDGGAIWNSPNISGGTLDIDIVNATFSRNAATDEGGSIYTVPNNFAGFFDVSIVNSIMWNSTSGAGFNEICIGSGQVAIGHSDVRAILGAGVIINCDGGTSVFVNNGSNRSQNPQFIDADGADAVFGTLDDNLDLQSISPVIDRGRNNAISELLDFLGRTRKVDGPDVNATVTVDMGAFEYQ